MAKVEVLDKEPASKSSVYYRGHITGKVYVRGLGADMICLEDGRTLDYKETGFHPIEVGTKIEITV